MERRPASSVAREQSLRREEAKLTLRPVVPPVTLERKLISMLNPCTHSPAPVEAARHSPAPIEAARLSTDMTSSGNVSAAPSVPPTSATAGPRVAAAAPAVSTAPLVAAPAVSTAPRVAAAAPAVSTAPRVAAAAPAVSTAPLVAAPAPDVSTAPLVAAPAPAVSTAPLVAAPAPAVSTAPLVAATAATAESGLIVGGKRPLGEESSLIIMVQQQQQEQQQPAQQQQAQQQQLAQQQPDEEQTHLLQQKPEDATETLSTNQTTSERGREPGRKRAKAAVQFSDVSPKRDVSHVMKFFQEQEQHLQDSFLSLPKRSQQPQRSPSPRLQQAAGLEHLDNLIRLMEQLTSLKDENSRLRKRCDFLESTKILLEVKRDLSLDSSSSSSGIMTLSPKQRQHHHHHDEHQHEKDRGSSSVDTSSLLPPAGRLPRPRISSAEELQYLQIADSSSDQAPKKAKSAMHKRSFSTGSLEVPSEMTSEMGGLDTRKRKGKSQRRIFGKSFASKQKSKGSRWARVKKVLTGQKIYEDLGTTIRTIRDLGRSTHISYSSSATQDVMSTSGSRVSTSNSRMSSSERHPNVGDNSRSRDNGAARPGLTVRDLQQFQEVEDTELTSEIWMGPPGWWEEYQASRDNDGASTNSEVSSVIEVTTMYLGSKHETTAATSTTPSLIKTTTIATTTTSPATAPLHTVTQETYLTIERPLSRRQSSPSLVMKELEEQDDIVQELASSLEATRLLHKSASCKSADLDIQQFGEGKQSKKSHRSAWGRVKDIIHTRKDSIKKKPKRAKTGIDSEEASEVDMDVLLEDHWSSDVFDDGLLGRSTPRSSPMVIRQQSSKRVSDSLHGVASSGPKTSPSRMSGQAAIGSPGNVDMAALLAGSVSTEFNKKMQEWEEIRRKKTSFRVSLDESDLRSLDVSHVSPQLSETPCPRVNIMEQTTDCVSQEEPMAVMDVLGAPYINVEEIHRRMTDSFSRKMQEWERLKYRGGSSAVREPSPDEDKKESKTRKDERQKSKRSREEKEKEKWERQREREMQKVEREQVKLEKEKQRLEKERLRTLEREAKLEMLKGRLSQVDIDGSLRKPGLSALAEYKVTADFARKLHEWELKKGLSHDVSNSIYLEAQKMSMQHLRRGDRMDPQAQQDQARYEPTSSARPPGLDKASPPPRLVLQPYWESPESSSPVEKYSEASLADDDTCTSVTEECLTRSNISSLERANKELLESLQKKELEYAAVQEQVHKVNEKLASVRENHTTEMARFHRELARGGLSGPVNLQVEELETTVGDLEQRIHMMENLGETLASSMESAAIGKWQSIEGEGTVHTQLVELVDQMRQMLAQASQSEEQSQKTMALTNFETLYTQAMKLQVQMNNLRLSHLERNREIMMIKRQLLLQEVNNLLLQADITRRETELYQFHEAKRFSSLKRWNTFSGAERHRPHTQADQLSMTGKSGQQQEARLSSREKPEINIPQMTENLVLACSASFSTSAPASPLYVTSVGKPCAADSVSGAVARPVFYPGAAAELSTDHVETHLFVSPAVTRRDHQLRPTAASRFHLQDSTTNISGYQSPGIDVHQETCAHQLEASAAGTSTTASYPVQPLVARAGQPATAAPTTITQGNIRSVTTPHMSTVCDSVPLHLEIEQLKHLKRKVEKGPPTLKRSECEGLSAAPSPGKVPPPLSSTEAPTPTIPKQRDLDQTSPVSAVPVVDNDNSLAPSVMGCTESLRIVEQTDIQLGTFRGDSPGTQAAEVIHSLPLTSDHNQSGSISPRSPINKHILRSQREETDAPLKDYRAISPQGSPVAARGKPPLPRHVGAVAKRSPTSSSASDKGPRSKSVSDMEHRMSDCKMAKPLQEVLNRFEKRATVCDSEDHPIELRKTPSPTLHLPRVGLVSRVRRLKPAAELLEESQRYRSGHSIYATRILNRYLPTDQHRPDASHSSVQGSCSYVQSIDHRLSCETTPVQSRESSRKNSDAEVKPSDRLRAESGFVEKLSSLGKKEARMEAASDGKELLIGCSSRSQERTLSDSDIDRKRDHSSSSTTKAYNRRSCEVAIVLSSTSTPVSETSDQTRTLKLADSSAYSCQTPGSSISPSSHQSLPVITHDLEPVAPTEEAARTRAATYCVSDIARSQPTRQAEATITQQPSVSSSLRSEQPGGEQPPQSIVTGGTNSTEKAYPSSLPSPALTGRRQCKMGTVGVLCKQSISFDLGVSIYSQKAHVEESSARCRQAHSWDPSHTASSAAASAGQQDTSALSPATSTSSEEAAAEQRPMSTSCEGEMAPSSPSCMEKKRSRRFLHSAWLQKSKQFFKASK